ncbi:STAS domain-containing protein [Streptomyces sp. NPDC018029]|uniref:STAS domain-containing protein n=1 Tax=Streptomyces sp. NPDC018029 TaxID=3365032 RepID=UPI0037B4DD1C
MPSSTPTTSCIASVHAHGHDLVVSLRGEIDVATAPAITSYLDTLTPGHHADLLIDLRRVTFMDGSGVRVLTRARARQGGRLRLICTQSMTLKLLRHPSLRLHFEILDHLPPPAPRTVA